MATHIPGGGGNDPSLQVPATLVEILTELQAPAAVGIWGAIQQEGTLSPILCPSKTTMNQSSMNQNVVSTSKMPQRAASGSAGCWTRSPLGAGRISTGLHVPLPSVSGHLYIQARLSVSAPALLRGLLGGRVLTLSRGHSGRTQLKNQLPEPCQVQPRDSGPACGLSTAPA